MAKRILKVNGVFIQDPSSLDFQLYDLDSEEGSGRNQLGMMLRDRVATKRKLVCKFPPMYEDEARVLLNAVKDMFFTVEYPDPTTGKRETMTAYVGDRTMPVYTYDYKKNMYLYSSVAFNIIER
jgi:hypothetical protein